MTAHQLAERYSLPLSVVRKRLHRGVPLERPYRKRENRPKAYVPEFVPDPLNASFRAWKFTTRGRALNALRLQPDLKARI